MSDHLGLGLGVILLLINALFVGAEFSLLSSRRDRLETLAHQGVSRARLVINAGDQGSLMLTSAQLGITLCSLGLGRLAEPALAHQLEGLAELIGLHLPGPLLHALAFMIALAVVVVLHVLVGEMVPKNLAIAEPERLAIWLVPVLVGFVKLARPFIALFNMMANGVLRLLRVEPKDELSSAATSSELAELLVESRREGLLEPSEHQRLAQTLSSVGHTVTDVLVPLPQVTTLPSQPTVGDVQRAVATTGFSRFPLAWASTAAGTPARSPELHGYLHVKDVLDLADADSATRIGPDRIRSLPTLRASARLDDALTTLRRARSHLALAVDSAGTVLGVVALEDVVEEYVGTVRDATHVRK